MTRTKIAAPAAVVAMTMTMTTIAAPAAVAAVTTTTIGGGEDGLAIPVVMPKPHGKVGKTVGHPVLVMTTAAQAAAVAMTMTRAAAPAAVAAMTTTTAAQAAAAAMTTMTIAAQAAVAAMTRTMIGGGEDGSVIPVVMPERPAKVGRIVAVHRAAVDDCGLHRAAVTVRRS